MMSRWTIFWIVVIAGAVAYMWRAGHLARLANYIRETRVELEKCTWPSWAELRGSTVVVMISLALLGGFTVVSDKLFSVLLGLVTSWFA